jgi:hypothetical protein
MIGPAALFMLLERNCPGKEPFVGLSPTIVGSILTIYL